ncbi:MAG: efflux RND transporter permease subunit, partial [Planctomycetes bacterium]|nr:efflux RND transporter permease subunit [Planctomycetota bacterium]
VRQGSLDVPAGDLTTSAGDVLLRTRGQAYRGDDFAVLPLITRADGVRLTVGDVAHVRDAFAEVDDAARFDGQPSVVVKVYRVGDQNALELAATVRDYVASAKDGMPAGITLTVWNDFSTFLRGRIDLLVNNAVQGFFLVFLVLALFLRFKLAFWVSVGIPVSFFGCLMLMPTLDVTINMISLFSFILVLGIVVDDAIVIGENVHTWQARGLPPGEAAKKGTLEVALPVTVAVLTAVIAFMPMMFIEGFMGKIFRVIPIICVTTLMFSLIETQLALPAHLSHPSFTGTLLQRLGFGPAIAWCTHHWGRVQGAMNGGLQRFVARVYQPILERCLAWRYTTLAAFTALVVVTGGMVVSGIVGWSFFPEVEGDHIIVSYSLPPGASKQQSEALARRIEAAALKVQDETGGPGAAVSHLLVTIGSQPMRGQRDRGAGGSGANIGELVMALRPTQERTVTTREVEQRWRALTGPVPEARELTFSSAVASAGEAINIQLSGHDMRALVACANAIKVCLATIAGVHSITDTRASGKRELVLGLKPEAEALGLREADLARQVRQAFYGEEAQRVQRGRDEVKVMVRYPESERRALGDLDQMRIRVDGQSLPLSEVAEVVSGEGYTLISRAERERIVNVKAGVDPALARTSEINAALQQTALPDILRDFPGVSFDMEGEAREQQESMMPLLVGFAGSLVLIYVVIAVSFRSYILPMVIMGAIPFGVIGAVLGHVVMGLDLTILSICGVVALSGVVVNDSIVLVDFVNAARAEGVPLTQAIRQAGARRFRPILLTSATTFIGLVPVIIAGRQEVQAQFLVPMAVSLGFGGVFSTVISLILVPTSYLVLDDLRRLFSAGDDAAHAVAPASV